MKKQSYIVIGLGAFGQHVVRALSRTAIELFVIDQDAGKLEDIAGIVLNTVCGDAADPDVLGQLGISNFDGAVVDMDRGLENSVLITMQLKELGVPKVIAKAANEIEARVLRRVGADKVILPDREAGIRLANQIAGGNYFEAIELSQNYNIVDFAVPADWFKKSIREIGIRTKYGVTVIGVRRNGELLVNPSPDVILQSGDMTVLLGEDNQMNTLQSRFG